VHNLCLNASTDHKLVFRHADSDAVCCCLTKMAVAKAFERPLSHLNGAIPWLSEMVVQILAKYRQYCSAQSSSSQLILPEALKTLPLYMLGLMKSPAFIENKALPTGVKVLVRAHERAVELHKLLAFPPAELINSMYPRM
jgi:protein transport protein SEC24